jgi:ABC-2 type transport system ATP-binding protein
MNAGIIDIRNLTKYYGHSRGVENINLKVDKGDIFGFIGPNGAGKSTTIRILLNLIFPDKGSAEILGMDVVKDSKKIKAHIGYIPSDANLYDKMGVKEFLIYCCRFYKIRDAEERIQKLSGMFELDLARKMEELSMGNKKKVSIIQSLIHRPDILILDEPTTGLDPLIQATFFDLLRNENKKGTTIFFSSHVLSEVQAICNKVAIIKNGTIIKVENIETLRSKQLKKIHIDFEGNVPENFKIDGIETVDIKSNGYLSFTYSGEINHLVKELSALKITNLLIEEPDLEEIFLHYYK